MKNNKYVIKNMALCEGRHQIPDASDGALFPNTINPLEFDKLETQVYRFILDNNVDILNLYITGMTVALVAVINACIQLNIELNLFHYNRETGEYFVQETACNIHADDVEYCRQYR